MKSYAHSFQQWSDCLPMVEFAINNSVHASTGHTPFYVNARNGGFLLKWGRIYGCIRTTADERRYRHGISDDNT
ncbi:hypothetical protein PC116_g28171 [Phytophthora cactorum]|nr:hypothetical protein PC116_g28171 [Phytophthora cactorum]